jgi:hypothetical protein
MPTIPHDSPRTQALDPVVCLALIALRDGAPVLSRVPRVLDDAARLLVRAGHCRYHEAVDERGAPVRPTSPDAVAYSLGGALDAAADGDSLLSMLAGHCLVLVGDAYGVDAAIPSHVAVQSGRDVWTWASLASTDAVLDLVRAAIAHAEVSL